MVHKEEGDGMSNKTLVGNKLQQGTEKINAIRPPDQPSVDVIRMRIVCINRHDCAQVLMCIIVYLFCLHPDEISKLVRINIQTLSG
jgi:hypothetical protein